MSFADGTGFYVAPKQYAIAADLAESYGYSDMEGEASVLDAIVKLHTLLLGNDTEDVNAALTVNGETGFITNFMSDGSGKIVGLVNSVLGSESFGNTPLHNGDRVEFFIPQDADYMDTYA
jgi:hypothetical protein